MTIHELFLKYLPVLIVLTPLVGVMNVVIVGRVDRVSVARTFLTNLGLTSVLLAILVFAFDYGPQRSGLLVAESFQSFSRIALPTSRMGDPFLTSQPAFGVDGLSLPLVAIVVLLPLATYAREKPDSGFALSLCLQTSLLAIVLTLDWRIMCGALFAAALLLRLLLARTLSSEIFRRTTGWSGRTFFGDVLLASGTMFFFLLASNYFQVRGENYSSVIFELRDFFVRVEYFEEFEAERVAGLSLATAPALGMLWFGAVLRLPLFVNPVSRSRAEFPADRIAAIWMWLYGPVIAVFFATRAIQLAPEISYALLAPFRAILIAAMFILGLVANVSPANRETRSRLLWPLGILLTAGVCTPNPTALAGTYLLLGFLPVLIACRMPAVPAAASLEGGPGAVPVSVIPVVLGSLLILLGVFQGSGSADRGLLELLVAGTGLTLLVLSLKRVPSERLSLVTEPTHDSFKPGEYPVWEREIPVPKKCEGNAKTRSTRILTRAVLIVGLLILPHQAWQRIRWDVQKIDFPTVASDRQLSQRSGSTSNDHEFAVHPSGEAIR